ncbi:copper resistance protein NlpE N-terminal domain-containing protein [Luteimonas sp. A482]
MRSSRALAPLSILIVVALAACAPEPDAAPAPATSKVEEPALPADPLLAGTDASAVIRHDATDPAGFDRKAFAGTFAGILPCADCPGIETSVEIRADGTYSQAEVQQGAEAARATGTWTVNADGSQLLLDPETKQADDRRFAIVSRDEIRLLDADGAPLAGDGYTSLRRN